MSLLTGESGDLRVPDGEQEHRKRVSGRPGPPSDPATNWSSSPPAAWIEHQVRALRRSYGRHLQGLLPGWHCSVSWNKKNNIALWLKSVVTRWDIWRQETRTGSTKPPSSSESIFNLYIYTSGSIFHLVTVLNNGTYFVGTVWKRRRCIWRQSHIQRRRMLLLTRSRIHGFVPDQHVFIAGLGEDVQEGYPGYLCRWDQGRSLWNTLLHCTCIRFGKSRQGYKESTACMICLLVQ